MKLISWNVRYCGKNSVSKLVEAISARSPHVVALQDINIRSVEKYEKEFSDVGLTHVVHSFHDDSEIHPTGVLIASCFHMDTLPKAPSSMLWPKGSYSLHIDKVTRHWARRMLFVSLNSDWGIINLYNAYITPASHQECISGKKIKYPWLKLDLLSGVYQTLSQSTDRLRILCGDFNTPQEENFDGKIITWGYKKKNGSYKLIDLNKHQIELSILRGLGDCYDISDVYRSLHGYANGRSEETWSWEKQKRRYDHIFASKALSPVRAEYLSTFRANGLSDHLPIEVVFEPNKRA